MAAFRVRMGTCLLGDRVGRVEPLHTHAAYGTSDHQHKIRDAADNEQLFPDRKGTRGVRIRKAVYVHPQVEHRIRDACDRLHDRLPGAQPSGYPGAPNLFRGRAVPSLPDI